MSVPELLIRTVFSVDFLSLPPIVEQLGPSSGPASKLLGVATADDFFFNFEVHFFFLMVETTAATKMSARSQIVSLQLPQQSFTRHWLWCMPMLER